MRLYSLLPPAVLLWPTSREAQRQKGWSPPLYINGSCYCSLLLFLFFFSPLHFCCDVGKCVNQTEPQTVQPVLPTRRLAAPQLCLALSSPWRCRPLAQQREPQCSRCGVLSDCHVFESAQLLLHMVIPNILCHLLLLWPSSFWTVNTVFTHALPLMDCFVTRR